MSTQYNNRPKEEEECRRKGIVNSKFDMKLSKIPDYLHEQISGGLPMLSLGVIHSFIERAYQSRTSRSVASLVNTYIGFPLSFLLS
jgi:hypothetical protein